MSNMGEDKLSVALRLLSRNMEHEQAPPQLEATLGLAFRQQHRRPLWKQVWFPATAAAVALLAAGVAWMWSRPQPAIVVHTPKPIPIAPVARPAVAEVKPVLTTRKPRPKRTVQVAKAKPKASAEQPEIREIATDFLPVGIPGPMTTADTGRIVRVRVPRSTMTGFGFPVNPDRMMESVKADVMLGDGGMVRAIRFVQ